MKIDELTMFGTGRYDIGITLEPIPHLRGNRYDDDGYDDGLVLLARIKGGMLLGGNKSNCFEANMLAPDGVEDYDGSRILLASFEFHSLNLDSASSNGVIRYKGFLSGANAHPQEVYDSLVDLKTPEEFEKISALTTATGGLKYFPPEYEAAKRFMGWEARVTMKPYMP